MCFLGYPFRVGHNFMGPHLGEGYNFWAPFIKTLDDVHKWVLCYNFDFSTARESS